MRFVWAVKRTRLGFTKPNPFSGRLEREDSSPNRFTGRYLQSETISAIRYVGRVGGHAHTPGGPRLKPIHGQVCNSERVWAREFEVQGLKLEG